MRWRAVVGDSARARRDDALRAGPQHGRDDRAVHRRRRSDDRRRDLDRDRLRAAAGARRARARRRRRLALVLRRRARAAGAGARSGSRCSTPRCRNWPAGRRSSSPPNATAMVARASVDELFARAPEPKSFATVASDHTFAGDNSRAAVLAWLNERHPRDASRRAALGMTRSLAPCSRVRRSAALQPPPADPRSRACRAGEARRGARARSSAPAGSARRCSRIWRRPASAASAIVDDDEVDVTNLQRQILYDDRRRRQIQSRDRGGTAARAQPADRDRRAAACG